MIGYLLACYGVMYLMVRSGNKNSSILVKRSPEEERYPNAFGILDVIVGVGLGAAIPMSLGEGMFKKTKESE